jgi:plasmid stabilization system protein ParE
MEYEVVLSPRAKRDLIAIHKYIAKDDHDSATRFCQQLTREAFSLRDYPERHGTLGKISGARKRATDNYLIVYDVFPLIQRMEILRFWHAARDQRKLRFKEEEPEVGYGEALAGAKLEA